MGLVTRLAQRADLQAAALDTRDEALEDRSTQWDRQGRALLADGGENAAQPWGPKPSRGIASKYRGAHSVRSRNCSSCHWSS